MSDTDTEIVEVMARTMCREDSAQMGEPDGCDNCDGIKPEKCYFHGQAELVLAALIAKGYVIRKAGKNDALEFAQKRIAELEQQAEFDRKLQQLNRRDY